MHVFLNLHDWHLRLFDEVRTRYDEPAVAQFSGTALCFGTQAMAGARLHPRQTNHHYLARLNADPLPYPLKGAANNADLIYQQLKQMDIPEMARVVVVVPGTLTTEQLGLFLGIAQEAGLAVSAFLDAAVAACASAPAGTSFTYLDLRLHDALLTTLHADREVRFSEARSVAHCGILQLVDGLANLVADRFVNGARFDPMHSADTEQQLYDQIFALLRQPERAEYSFQIQSDATTREVQITGNELKAKLAQRLAPLLEAAELSDTVMLSESAIALPWFSSIINARAAQVAPAGPIDPTLQFERLRDRLAQDDEHVRLIRELPVERAVPRTQPTPAVIEVTHVLEGAEATPIAGRSWPFEPSAYPPGKAFTVDGTTYTLIRVTD